ncbi:fibroblast growth factor receptor-like 1 isoform X1 [Branchiostoma floridae]|uniref:Fibroblast growth factor receptor-like 1 n=2 Tax=Branchiostoma floridae TaxID=7739 RepID=A0A9J7KXU4_BRAFL|nr:fibroblast growth factor receptor-like 1 isoform X1 [Branchiostoma floridae]
MCEDYRMDSLRDLICRGCEAERRKKKELPSHHSHPSCSRRFSDSSVRRPVQQMMAMLWTALLFFLHVQSTLGARGPPRLSERVITHQTVRLGRNIKLPCPVEGDPPPLTMWTKDLKTIHSGWTRFRVLRQGLKIKNAEAHDAGHYTCKATNGFGSINVNYSLTVIDDSNPARPVGTTPVGGTKPRFTQPQKMRRKIIQRPMGSSVRLKCSASGQPKPEIIWSKDGRTLTDEDLGGAKKGQRWTLKLRNLRPRDSGRYTCKVFNRIGSINATYKVDVIARMTTKPQLTGVHPVNTTVDFGTTASFQCRVRSGVKPHIQWLKRVEEHELHKHPNTTIDVGGVKFIVLPTGDVWSRPDGSYLNKLMISKAKEEDSGMYICLGANTMGYSYKAAFLTVKPDPDKVEDPAITTKSVMSRSSLSSKVPLVVVIGIPAALGLILVIGGVWFCQQRKRCPSPPASVRTPTRQYVPQHDATSHGTTVLSLQRDKDSSGSLSSGMHPPSGLLSPAASPTGTLSSNSTSTREKYLNRYADIHTHTHTHTEGVSKVYQHQHIHYQC